MRILFLFLAGLLLAGIPKSEAQGVIPRPDHIVICVLENHAYEQILDSTVAPYIWSLANSGANMQQFYALTHPSQPNYLLMFSGSNQGEVTNNLPPFTPLSTPNLGASLIQQGFTFSGYSEDLPSVGSTVFESGSYARKHSPWINWQGAGVNRLPDSCNLPFSMFPTDFNQLPHLCFVIPNQDNDMHNGIDPDRIIIGDNWVRDHLGDYVTWAQTHNSLFILTFDEDNGLYENRIPCIFKGPMIRPGNYSMNYYNLLDLLRTLEEIYGLPRHGQSRDAIPILEIWQPSALSDRYISKADVVPNPFQSSTTISFINKSGFSGSALLMIDDESGKMIRRISVELTQGKNEFTFRKEDLPSGVYFFSIESGTKPITEGKLIIQ